MQVARVIGDIVATRKDRPSQGLKLLVLQPLDSAQHAVGRPLVAADAAGAGSGELVFFVRGPRSGVSVLSRRSRRWMRQSSGLSTRLVWRRASRPAARTATLQHADCARHRSARCDPEAPEVRGREAAAGAAARRAATSRVVPCCWPWIPSAPARRERCWSSSTARRRAMP